MAAVVTGLGYQFVGAQYGRHGGGGLLRVYIDVAAGETSPGTRARAAQASDAAAPGEELAPAEHTAQGGVDVEDCARVSQQLSAVLDVEDPIREAYVLEVSSPGTDRPLFGEADFRAYHGALVRVRLHHLVDGRRNFKGRLVAGEGSTIAIEGDGQVWQLDYEDIDEARLVPEYP